jgi:hypothetical protein
VRHKKVVPPESIICLDIEASGLGSRSYPIEIAWKRFDETSFDCFLINPETGYNWNDWDESAAQVHGIAYQDLLNQGIDVRVACARLNSQLAGCTVYSDAFEFDYFWMRRLFDAAMVKPKFQLDGIESLLSVEQLDKYQRASKESSREHRAMSDVDDLLLGLKSCLL